MKQFFAFLPAMLFFTATVISCSSAKTSNRVSPRVSVSQKIGESAITIHYGQPSVKGRKIGIDLEPFPDSIWRAGANEATVFEADKDVLVEGKTLPKGKYAFFLYQKGRSWLLIFNKKWNQWGTKKYSQADDEFRVPVRGSKTGVFAEKLIYQITPDGIVTIQWGDLEVNFQVQEKK